MNNEYIIIEIETSACAYYIWSVSKKKCMDYIWNEYIFIEQKNIVFLQIDQRAHARSYSALYNINFQDLNPIFYSSPLSDRHWVVSEQVAYIVDQKKGRNLPPFLPKVSTRLKVRGNCLFQYFCNKSELTSLPGQPMTNLG